MKLVMPKSKPSLRKFLHENFVLYYLPLADVEVDFHNILFEIFK